MKAVINAAVKEYDRLKDALAEAQENAGSANETAQALQTEAEEAYRAVDEAWSTARSADVEFHELESQYETAVKVLRDLSEDGVIEVKDRVIVVPDAPYAGYPQTDLQAQEPPGSRPTKPLREIAKS